MNTNINHTRSVTRAQVATSASTMSDSSALSDIFSVANLKASDAAVNSAMQTAHQPSSPPTEPTPVPGTHQATIQAIKESIIKVNEENPSDADQIVKSVSTAHTDHEVIRQSVRFGEWKRFENDRISAMVDIERGIEKLPEDVWDEACADDADMGKTCDGIPRKKRSTFASITKFEAAFSTAVTVARDAIKAAAAAAAAARAKEEAEEKARLEAAEKDKADEAAKASASKAKSEEINNNNKKAAIAEASNATAKAASVPVAASIRSHPHKTKCEAKPPQHIATNASTVVLSDTTAATQPPRGDDAFSAELASDLVGFQSKYSLSSAASSIPPSSNGATLRETEAFREIISKAIEDQAVRFRQIVSDVMSQQLHEMEKRFLEAVKPIAEKRKAPSSDATQTNNAPAQGDAKRQKTK